MKLLKIFQVGEPVLRQAARPLSTEEITSDRIQQLIELMRETMRDDRAFGLAAPQIGEPLQLAVIEDREEYLKCVSPDDLAKRERAAVQFHVIINPQLSIEEDTSVKFFEGCASLDGFAALVPRAIAVQVKCLNEHGETRVIDARGWYARILQHEIDHLHGKLYIDRMDSRSFMTVGNRERHWKGKSIEEIEAALLAVP